jgi:hypothetical protein
MGWLKRTRDVQGDGGNEQSELAELIDELEIEPVAIIDDVTLAILAHWRGVRVDSAAFDSERGSLIVEVVGVRMAFAVMDDNLGELIEAMVELETTFVDAFVLSGKPWLALRSESWSYSVNVVGAVVLA